MIDCQEVDTTIAIAMSKIERMLHRVQDMNDLVLVMAPDIFCSLSGRKEFFTSVDITHENGVMGMYYGFDVFVVDTRTCDEPICVPAFRCNQECVNMPIQAEDYFLFKDYGALYKSNDGERIYDTNIRVTNGIEYETIRTMADKAFEARYITSPYITSSYAPTDYSWMLLQSDFAWKSPYEGWCASDIFKMPKKKVEPELETTNEFDEFIAQFKRK